MQKNPGIPNDYQFRLKDALLGMQMLTIAVGALVLVPLLTGMDPSVALFTAGVGTLIFQYLTKGQIPAFLGSSFAFVPATIYGMQNWGLPSTLCGLAVGGSVYFFMSLLVYTRGHNFIHRILPPIVTGPVITSIGLVLAPTAINMAMGKNGSGSIQLLDEKTALIVAFIALFATILTRLFAKGKMRLIPLLIGIFSGYIASLYFGIVTFDAITNASWLQMPKFSTPTWHWQSVLLFLPIAAVSAIEHIGDIFAVGAITKRNYVKYPGLHRSLLGDGIATTFASLIGGPPNTTYSEVTAGVALTKIHNPGIMTWACIAAISLAFIGKIGASLQTIPTPVMGGILILLFGAIAVTGLNLLTDSKEDLMDARNMTIVGIILVLPVGGLSIGAGDFALEGIGLGGLVGVLLNLLLPRDKKIEAAA
jgi:uracil permease